MPTLGVELLEIARQQGIGGEDQIVLGDLREQRLALGAMQGQHAQFGCEAFGLVLPVGDQTGGHDDQRRAAQATGLPLGEDVRQGLQGLAQAHIVGEDAADLQLTQRLHPAQALQLIVAQFGAQPGRRLHRLLRQLLQAPGKFAQTFAALPVQGGNLVQLGEPRRIGLAQTQTLALNVVLAEVQLAEAGQQRPQPAERQSHAAADPMAARQRHQQFLVVATLGERLAAQQPGRVTDGMQEDRQQADLLAVHLDAHLQVEPVALRRFLDAHLPLAEGGEVELEVGMQADLPAALAQLRQLFADEVQPGGVIGQLERLAGALRQCLAAAQGDAEALLGQLAAQRRFGLELADDT
ncbi:hypothetical protein D3C84_288690 [compost metagenome]